jgi:AraC-like DNA-binding protein
MPTASQPGRSFAAPATVLSRVVARLLELAVAAGMDRGTLLAITGLAEADLADGDARIPYSIVVALWEAAGAHTGDPDLGLHWSAGLQTRDWGLVGYAMSFSDTLGAALGRLERYCRILTDSAEFSLERLGDQHVAATDTAVTLGCRPSIDYRLGAVLRFSRMITRVDVIPVEARFTYPQPASILVHRELFRCPLSFGQTQSRVVLHARDLELPIPRGDETLAGYLSEHTEAVRRSLITGTSVRERVRTAVWGSLSEGKPTLRQVAKALEMSHRSLQRHLANEGTSLNREVDDIRKRVALAALKDRRHSVEEVAFFLGYAEPSTFFRSFRRWTGTTPHRYRSTA